MATNQQNKHGLSRAIPAAIKRQVRQACGFGCVVCGSAIYDYEHHSPEFKNAKAHSSEGITLLCQLHHEQKQKGLLSHESYQEAIRSPRALRDGQANTTWTPGDFAPQILVGLKTFTGGTSVLRIGGDLLLGFEKPEQDGGPPRLTFRAFDHEGREIFGIVHNEIIVPNTAFDVESTGRTWKLNSAPYQVDLKLRLDPPTRVTIQSLQLRYRDWSLVLKGSSDLVLKFDGKPVVSISGAMRVSGPCLYVLDPDRPNIRSDEMTLVGGGGPAPLGSRPKPEGKFELIWPLYVVERDGSPLIIEHDGTICFNTYLYVSMAEDCCPPGFKVSHLSQSAWLTMLKETIHSKNVAVFGFNVGAEKFPHVAPTSDVLGSQISPKST